MSYKKIIVFILTITLLSSISLALEVKDSASGVDFQLYLSTDGKLYGIGNNDQGELGIGDAAESEYEEVVEITTDVLLPEVGDSVIKKTITTGADFSAIIKNDKKVYVTGENYFGQLGLGYNIFEAKKGFTVIPGEHNANIVSISAGADFILLLNENGEVYGTGDNGFGQIRENGEAVYSELVSVYIPEDASKKAKAIATGSRHSVILLEDGKVITLGDNEYYQKNIIIPTGRKAVEIAAGGYHTLIRLDDNTVWGVGNNEDQQIAKHIGNGDKGDKAREEMIQLLDEDGQKLKVDNPNSRIRNIAAGFDFSMAVKRGKDGKISVTGLGSKHKDQLGKEAKTKAGNSVKIETIDTIENISASWQHTIIMGKDKNKDKTESKGNKFYGEVGVGKPMQDQDINSIAMGAGHSLYVKDNTLYGAGANGYGQLGVATYSSYVRKIPFNVTNVGGIKQIATGATHSVILGFDGSVWATGYNYSGQLGLGDNKDRSAFTKLTDRFDSQVIAIAAGGDVTMILTQNGTVYAMGDNTYGQINSDPAAAKTYNIPTIYSESQNIVAIAAGIRHTLALDSTGKVIARGENTTAINETENVKKIAAGAYHSLLLMNDSSVQAFGKNNYGQLGLGGTSTGIVNGTVDFTAASLTVKNIAAGYTHSVFLTTDGIYVTGAIDGETAKELPTKYANVIDPKEIATGWLGNIVKTATSIVTIGNNEYGQRGSYKGEEATGYDNEIDSLSKKKVAAGYGYTMVLHSDGTLWGVGENSDGQLGTGDNIDKNVFVKISTPVPVGNIADVVAGLDFTLLVTRDGELYGTGKNSLGLFGNKATVLSINKFIKLDINDVKIACANRGSIFVIKNDGSLWGIGSVSYNFIQKMYNEFTKVQFELAEGEYIKDAFIDGTDLILIKSDNIVDTPDIYISLLGKAIIGGENISNLTNEKLCIAEMGGNFKLKDNKLYITSNFYGYETEVGGLVHMITTEGTNELINNPYTTTVIGQPFTEGIEDVAIAIKGEHIVVVTESGQLYAMGGNYLGELGNGTLNENNITYSKVFVPMYIQTIAPTTGVVVQ